MNLKVSRNSLEIESLENLKSTNKPNLKCKIELLDPPNFKLNQFFYKQIGKDHRWIDRLEWSDQKWINYAENKNVKTFIFKNGNDLAGYYEEVFHEKDNNIEIAYFGVLKEYYGKGFGSFLLSEAIKNCFKKNIKKVWLHTCSLDHKNALNNYLSRGMKIYKSETLDVNVN